MKMKHISMLLKLRVYFAVLFLITNFGSFEPESPNFSKDSPFKNYLSPQSFLKPKWEDFIFWIAQAEKEGVDSGKYVAIQLGIHPSLVKPGIRFITDMRDLYSWEEHQMHDDPKLGYYVNLSKRGRNRGILRTEKGVKRMLNEGLDTLPSAASIYFVPKLWWLIEGQQVASVVHELLHDVYLNLPLSDKRAFIEKVREMERRFSDTRFEKKYYKDIGIGDKMMALYDQLMTENIDKLLEDPESLIFQSDFFARLGGARIGFPLLVFNYPQDIMEAFEDYFLRINFRITHSFEKEYLLRNLKSGSSEEGERAGLRIFSRIEIRLKRWLSSPWWWQRLPSAQGIETSA